MSSMSNLCIENEVPAVACKQDIENVRVMIVDDHPIVRLGIRAGLQQLGGMQVECEAEDGSTALELAADHALDVAIIDVRMPDMDGIEIAARLSERYPNLRIVFISGFFDSATIERGLQVGAHAFVVKSERPQRLAEFVRQALRGEFGCSEEVREIIEPTPEGFRLVTAGRPTLSDLSLRERALLTILARGATLKLAASSLGITYKAADHLKQQLMKKLRVHDRVELARFAFREGIAS